MNRKSALVAIGLVGLICAGAPVVALAAYNLLYFARELWSSRSAPTAPGPISTPATTATTTPSPVCGGPPTMFILLIGSDSRADSYSAGLADSMRIVRADFMAPGLTYIAFQRDLYVEIPGISAHAGITHGKLNQAYLYGNPAFGYYDGPGRGPGLLAITLQQNFGARVDHYVAVNLQAFERIVDQLGGLDIELPQAIDGRAARSADQDKFFPAGPLHLNGYRTMLLARMRPDGDLERSKTQNLILQAFAAELLTPEMLPRLPALVEGLYGSVQTDLGAHEIEELLCLGALLQPDDVHALSFPDQLFSGTRVHDPVLGNPFVWDVDFQQLREYVRQFNEGTWGASPQPTPTTSP
jgi:LCP family protein required for cell wall assembly